MTPKEKAKELFDKFDKVVNTHTNRSLKKCALIAVDEILKITYLKDFNYKEYFNNNNEFISYWQEVKQEIEKL